jgi:putative DNA primase/helicase
MIEDAGTFKMLTGDDKVEAEIKRVQERIKFTPTTKHIFSANQLPEVYEADDAFWRRILVVPFPNTVSEKDRVDELARKILDEEGAGILNWMVEGYERLVDEGGFTADRTPEETKKLWYTWSTPVIRFYARCMRDEVGGKADKTTVYDAYKQFCEKKMGVMPVTEEAFGKRLTKFPHIDSDRVKTGGRNKKTVYRNVVLREDLK